MLERTLERIDTALTVINLHPEYSKRVRDDALRALWVEANKHSLRIEQANEYRAPEQKKEDRDLLTHLEEAWNYLTIYGIKIMTFAVLGNLVEPIGHPYKTFRNGEAVIGDVPPPSSNAVPYAIRDLVEDLHRVQVHSIVRASHAHIELVRIHPYCDGNGRAGRLLQTYCLHEKGYPPAIIPEAERDIYTTLLRRTLRDRADKKSYVLKQSDNEKLFHSFIAAKVLESAEKLDQELQKRRMYLIEFNNGPDIEKIIATARQLRAYGKRYEGISVNIEKGEATRRKKGTKLLITGNISRDQVLEIMKKYRKQYRLRYKVVSNPYK